MPYLQHPIMVLDAPSNLGLRPPAPNSLPGVYRLPDALRAQRLVGRLQAHDAGRIPAPLYSQERDTATGFRNGQGLKNYAISLADQVSQMLDQAAFPLLLGGDCSILLGPMLALKRRGVYGLVFIDGHNDFCYPRDPARFPMLAAASLDLALVTGHGPDALTDIQGAKPYVREEHVVVLGYWDELEYADVFDFASFAASRVGRFDVTHVRRQGAAQAAQEALAMLTRQGVDQFWIHLDVDVLDRTVMPAVDSPNENGLTYGELIDIVRTLIASQRAVGMQLTIFDPDLDPEGRYAAELADAIVAIFHAPAGGDG